MRESHGKPGEYVLSVFSDDQRRHFIIQYADVSRCLIKFSSLRHCAGVRTVSLYRVSTALKEQASPPFLSSLSTISPPSRSSQRSLGLSCSTLSSRLPRHAYNRLDEFESGINFFVFFLQDKKWILNHEDVMLGELLGKVTGFP